MYIYTLNSSCKYPLSIMFQSYGLNTPHLPFVVPLGRLIFISSARDRHCNLDLWLRPKTLTIAECHTRRFG